MPDIRLTLRIQEFCEEDQCMKWVKKNTIQIDPNLSYHYSIENGALKCEKIEEKVKEKKQFTEQELSTETIQNDLDEVQRILEGGQLYE